MKSSPALTCMPAMEEEEEEISAIPVFVDDQYTEPEFSILPEDDLVEFVLEWLDRVSGWDTRQILALAPRRISFLVKKDMSTVIVGRDPRLDLLVDLPKEALRQVAQARKQPLDEGAMAAGVMPFVEIPDVSQGTLFLRGR